MKQWLICVGRPGRMLESAIAEYENRARRYWNLEVVEVKEQRAGRGVDEAQVRAAEGERILKRLPPAVEVVALSRTGETLTSAQLARRLEQSAVQGGADIAWVIGGAFGLDPAVLRTGRALALSPFTMPHDLARLVLLEQLYRAGTILRGEPYHKGTDEE